MKNDRNDFDDENGYAGVSLGLVAGLIAVFALMTWGAAILTSHDYGEADRPAAISVPPG